MTADALKTLLSLPISLFVLMNLASLGSALKQLAVIRQTGTPPSLLKYLGYWPETLGTVIANAIAFVGLVFLDQVNFVAVMGVGYGTNSLMDLLPGKRSLVLKAVPDDPVKVAPIPPPAPPPPPAQGGFAHPVILMALALLGALLLGCATAPATGPAPTAAQTEAQAYEMGLKAVDLALVTEKAVLDSGVISSAQGTRTLQIIDSVHSAVEAAHGLYLTGNTVAGSGQLADALSPLLKVTLCLTQKPLTMDRFDACIAPIQPPGVSP